VGSGHNLHVSRLLICPDRPITASDRYETGRKTDAQHL
jgi:hypothetical protein